MEHRAAILALAWATTLVASAPAQPRLYVDAAVTVSGDGSSWATAAKTLQQALAAATPGTEIWIAAGTYQGGFAVPANVALLGGFRPGHVRPTERRPRAFATILDGGGTQRVLVLGTGSLVDGVTVRNGVGQGGGGGASIDGTSPTIRGCLFTGNTNQGGRGSTLLVQNGAQPRVESSLFVQNAVPGSSHVIDILGAGGVYDHLVVAGNVNNGIHIANASSPTITSCMFVQNTGRGICDITGDNAIVLDSNLFWGNAAVYFYKGNDYQTIAQVNALPYARNNVSADPRFVAPASLDYRIASDSPAREAGVAGFASVGIDFWGNPRVLDADLDGLARTDIGAHELTNVTLAPVGAAAAGQPLTLALDGTPGLASVLFVGHAGPAQALPPLGTVLLNATPLLALPQPQLPAQVVLAVPTSFRGPVAFQAAAWKGFAANLSNLVDLTVR